MAAHVAERIRALPAYADMPKSTFVTELSDQAIPRQNRIQALNKLCPDNPVSPEAPRTPVTTRVAGGAAGLFDELPPPDVVLVSDSMGSPGLNFAGALSEHASVDVLRYDVPAGGLFTALLSYTSSEAYRQHRPKVLVWTFSVQGLTTTSDGKRVAGNTPSVFRELLPATRGDCSASDVIAEASVLVKPGRYTELLKVDPSLGLQGPDIYVQLDVEDPKVDTFSVGFTHADGAADHYAIEHLSRKINSGRYTVALRETLETPVQWVGVKLTGEQPTTFRAKLCRLPPLER